MGLEHEKQQDLLLDREAHELAAHTDEPPTQLRDQPSKDGFAQQNLQNNSGAQPSAELVREVLHQILESEDFKTSARGKQFLSYVVHYRLENHPEPLKERMIGAALFNRPLDYATGDDSVVRAQAREVRRRLERYNMAHGRQHRLRIELPLGSYTPEFRWEAAPELSDEALRGQPQTAHLVLAPLDRAHPRLPTSNWSENLAGIRRFWLWTTLLLCVLAALSALLYLRLHPVQQKSTLSLFWGPALASNKPLLICLPKPIFYRPSVDLYKRSEQYPGEFDREVYRMNHRPHLKINDTIKWGDMFEYYDFGVGQGDVQASVRFSNFLGHMGKDSEVRIGNGYSYEDLRNSPAIVIGAFSNPWTMEMTAGLHFSFVDDKESLRIQEQGAKGRKWTTIHGVVGEDYGLVTRLLDSNTGQFVVLVAGIEGSGSDAAADLIVDGKSLAKALKDAPRDWPQKNVQIVLSTTVKDFAAGPAKVIAVYVW